MDASLFCKHYSLLVYILTIWLVFIQLLHNRKVTRTLYSHRFVYRNWEQSQAKAAFTIQAPQTKRCPGAGLTISYSKQTDTYCEARDLQYTLCVPPAQMSSTTGEGPLSAQLMTTAIAVCSYKRAERGLSRHRRRPHRVGQPNQCF